MPFVVSEKVPILKLKLENPYQPFFLIIFFFGFFTKISENVFVQQTTSPWPRNAPTISLKPQQNGSPLHKKIFFTAN